MSEHCTQDGGFIGQSGCIHPNHQHSDLVKGLIEKSKTPTTISPQEADAALREGFYVNSAYNTRVGFGEKLIIHLRHHNRADQRRRKINLLFAIATVKGGKRGPNPKGGPNSFAYARNINGQRFLVLTDNEGNVEEVFDVIPKGGSK